MPTAGPDPDLEAATSEGSQQPSRTAAILSPGGRQSVHQIEDHPKGYPRFAALVASHESLQIYRRFSNIRARLLLIAQDEIVQLESRLDHLDRNEQRPLSLSSCRRDKNQERKDILKALREAIKDYDELLESSHRASRLEPAHQQDISSLQNWNKKHACLSRDDVTFLDQSWDLISLSQPRDNLVSWVERSLSDKVLSLSKIKRSTISRDSLFHIYPREYTILISRIIIAPVLLTLVAVPIAICSTLKSPTTRMLVTIASTSIFFAVLAVLTRGRVVELAIAGITYAAVLVTLISEA